MSFRLRSVAIAAVGLLLALVAESLVTSAASPFGPNVRVSEDPALASQRRPALVADSSGTVYATWVENRNGDSDLYFAKSTDGGRTWGPSKRIGGDPPPGSTQDRPSMALGPNGEVVVVWQDDRLTYFDFDIYASASFDGGGTFVLPVRASDGPPGTLQFAPSVSVGSGGQVAVAWQDFRSGNGDARISTATLASFLFGPSVRVDDDPGSGTQAAPSVKVGATGAVYVAYHDNRSGSADVYLAKSSDGGLIFGSSVRVDETGSATSAQGLVSIDVDGLGRIYAVWEDARTGEVETDGRPIFDIYFAVSTDGGRSFARNVLVADGPRKSSQEAPRIAVGAAGTIYVVWADGRNTDWDPYFAYSTDGGATFAGSIRVDDAGDSTTDPPLQYDPQVVESRTGLVFVAWEDHRGSTADIYGAAGYLAVGSALRVRVTLDADTVWPGDPTELTVRVTDNGTAVDGATISLSASGSGAFGLVQWTGAGTYRSSFTPAASTPDGTDIVLTVTAQKSGYVAGASQALLRVRKAILATIEPTWDLLAVGQTMEIRVSAIAHGTPLPDAAVVSGISWGGAMNPGSGTTDAKGGWSSWFTPTSDAGGSDVTISVTVSKDGYRSASVRVTIPILAQPRSLDISVASRTREMMSYERAAVQVTLTSSGFGVTGAILSPYCIRGGNFSVATEGAPGNYAFSWDAPKVASSSWAFLLVRAQRGGYADVAGRIPLLVDPNKTNPADPTQIFVSAVAQSSQVQSGQSIKVSVYVFTIEGYVVSGATIVVSFATGLGTVTRPVDELNGLYTFVYTAPSVQTDTGLFLRIDASKFGYAMGRARIGLIITL